MARTARGHTYLEVLVAAATVTVIVGLLLPAVSKVREAATRAKCTNNLKHLGTALLAYHDARGHLPPGGSAAPDLAAATPACREAGGWSWAYLLLPYLGHDGLYRNADPEAVGHTPMDVYLCPARRTAADRAGPARLDFVVNGGDQDRPTGVITPTGVPPLRLADLSGGTAGIVVFAGKRLNRAALGVSRDDDEAYATAGWGPDYEVYRTAAEHPAPDVDEPGNLEPRAGFGSSHPGAFCAGFADGSVRPLRYSIDPDVWQRACLRSGSAEPPHNNN